MPDPDSTIYDFGIIGAGPSGATAATLLADHFSIFQLDRRPLRSGKHPKARTKPCGGLLTADAQKILTSMGRGIPKHVLVDDQLLIVKIIDFDNQQENDFAGTLFNCDRELFDRWLVSLIPPSVDLRTETIFEGLTKEADGLYHIKFKENKQTKIVKAKKIIGADGAASRVKFRQFKTAPKLPKYIGIEEWFEMPDGNFPAFTIIFDSSITDYYAWLIPKDEFLIVGAALPSDTNTKERFGALKQKLIQHHYPIEKLVKKEGHPILRPRQKEHLFTGDNEIALVGEAAGYICPAFADGYTYALGSGKALANAILQNPKNFQSIYQKNLQPLTKSIRLKNFKMPIWYNVGIRKHIVKLTAVKISK